MTIEHLVDRLWDALLTGDRPTARIIIDQALDDGLEPVDAMHELIWPVLDRIADEYRADRLSTLTHHLATRLLRSLVEQVRSRSKPTATRGRTVMVLCGPAETDEIAGLLMADLLEQDGYGVRFGGGGVAEDEIAAEVGAARPDVLMMFSSGPADAPAIRRIIDTVRVNQAHPELQIVVGGGVFARARGLAEEIGADLWAFDPRGMLDRLGTEPERRMSPDQRTVGRTRTTTRAAA